MLNTLRKTLVFFVQWRFLSLKFWYTVTMLWAAVHVVQHPKDFTDAQFLGVFVSGFIGLGAHVYGQMVEKP